MKNSIKLLSIAFIFGAFLMSCEGPEGPPGKSTSEVCIECHNSATQSLVAEQYEESTHGTSAVMHDGSFTYQYTNTDRIDCQKCHVSEGFIETQHTGLDTVAAEFAHPSRIQCETCHAFHKTLDFEKDGQDFAIRTNTAVALLMDGGVTKLDLGDNSNLCANCHQPRTDTPADDGSGVFEVTSTRYGPHHGPQSTVLAGIKGYEVAGSVSYPTSAHAHTTGSSCVNCHMNEQNHTMEPSLNACNECHSNLTNFDYNGVQTEVEAKLASLETALKTAGLLTSTGGGVKGTWGIDSVGALYNFKTVEEDRSMGVHNPPYILALLQNSIEALQ